MSQHLLWHHINPLRTTGVFCSRTFHEPNRNATQTWRERESTETFSFFFFVFFLCVHQNTTTFTTTHCVSFIQGSPSIVSLSLDSKNIFPHTFQSLGKDRLVGFVSPCKKKKKLKKKFQRFPALRKTIWALGEDFKTATEFDTKSLHNHKPASFWGGQQSLRVCHSSFRSFAVVLFFCCHV